MGKTILYKLFKIGSIPKKLQQTLKAEGVVVYDEGISGSLCMKDFKSHGRRAKHRKELFSGFLAVTRKRVISHACWKRIINIPLDHEKFKSIEIEIVNSDLYFCTPKQHEKKRQYPHSLNRFLVYFHSMTKIAK
jgi:hypothetical protein